MKTLPVDTLRNTIIERDTRIVLFVDTCIFLNIVRSPIRENINNTEVGSAINLLKILEESKPKVTVVINETIKDEWSNNIQSTIEELKKGIKETTTNYKKIVDAYNFITPNFNFDFSNLIEVDLNTHLKNLSYNLLECAYIIQREDRHAVNAWKRVRENILPAQKGKAEPKDCEIFEAFIDLSKNLRTSGYSGKILFLTSNHRDFGKPNASTSLSQEMETLNSELINSLSWGLSLTKTALIK